MKVLYKYFVRLSLYKRTRSLIDVTHHYHGTSSCCTYFAFRGRLRILAALFSTLFVYYIAETYNEMKENSKGQEAYSRKEYLATKNKHGTPIEILMWGEARINRYLFQTDFTKCQAYSETGLCIPTDDLNRYNKSEVLLITSFGRFGHQSMRLKDRTELWPLKNRPAYQKWVFHGYESVYRSVYPNQMDKYDRAFNISMTYKRNSDIPIPYGSCNKVYNNKVYLNLPPLSERKLVLQVVSFCDTHSQREKYVDKLQEHIPVDIYGKCGMDTLPRNDSVMFSKTLQSYKFMLNFENSLCDEYITEKPFESLKRGVVPIVMGHLDYSKYLPPNSYLDIRDFKDPAELASHLKKIDADDNLYNQYHAWRSNYSCRTYNMTLSVCILCEYLHRTRNIHQSVRSIKSFWNVTKDCVKPKLFFRNILPRNTKFIHHY